MGTQNREPQEYHPRSQTPIFLVFSYGSLLEVPNPVILFILKAAYCPSHTPITQTRAPTTPNILHEALFGPCFGGGGLYVWEKMWNSGHMRHAGGVQARLYAELLESIPCSCSK